MSPTGHNQHEMPSLLNTMDMKARLELINNDTKLNSMTCNGGECER